MTPPPVVLGLTICDYTIIEEGTRRLSLIGMRTSWEADRFPFSPLPFFVHAALAEGSGDVIIELLVHRLDTAEEIHALRQQTRFVDKLREKHMIFRVRNCTFPVAGWYQFTLLADGEWISQRRVHLVTREEKR